MDYELTENSNKIEHPLDINIYLKNHQLAMVKKCIEIEEFNLCSYGVMNDKPGSGKSYAILAFILYMKLNNKYSLNNIDNGLNNSLNNINISLNNIDNNLLNYDNNFNNFDNSYSKFDNNNIFSNSLYGYDYNYNIDYNSVNNNTIIEDIYINNNINLLVIPSNIVNQWMKYINDFSNNILNIRLITEYKDVLRIYDDVNFLFENDIIITTSLFYHSICTTLNSKNIKIRRVFFDEIDSISSLLVYKINTYFTWFVSASFNHNNLGIYKNKIDVSLFDNIKCKCTNDFIDSNFLLDVPINYNIICKNIYLDNILSGILSKHQYRLLNANDFTTLCKKFNSKIATNVTEAIDYLIKDIYEIIETETIHIEALEKLIIDENNIEEYYQKKKDELNKKIEEIKKSVEECIEEEISNNTLKDNTQKVNIEELENIINARKTLEYNSVEQEEYKKELVIRKKSLAYNTERINLIKERLVENNCCPTCYEELEETDIKTISPCCKNMVCHKCVNHWYNVNKKTNCIYCNKADIKYDDFVIIKNINSENEVKCLVCNKDISLFIDHNDNLEDHTLYAECCKKNCCKNCLNIWYKTLYKKECLICHKDDILLDDFKNKKQHDEMLSNIKNGYKYIKKSKIQFLEYFISTKIINNASLKLIIFSDYINSFIEIKQLFNKSNILYTEFDGGNISEIENQLLEFKNGNVQVLMCNSLLFGCGMNLEFGTDIIFFHKMTDCMKKQVIGRCQRPGRKTRLNIWYLMHENENEYNIIREDTINDGDFIYSSKDDDGDNKLSVNDIINSYDFTYEFDDNDENKDYTVI
jgi:hypothetical protein